jgi:YebC/PmpR family DNA-binding regulatory protein
MSGHNKWSQIKHKKGAEDAKRSQRFSILARAITMEAKRANGDRNAVGLKTAIDKARGENLPNENIERAVKNAQGADASSLTEVLYECYGPGGVAMMIEGITDNKNRTSQEIKHLLSEHGATLATPGAVTWAFRKNDNGLPAGEAGWQALTPISISAPDRETLTTLIDALENNDAVQTVITNHDHNGY